MFAFACWVVLLIGALGKYLLYKTKKVFQFFISTVTTVFITNYGQPVLFMANLHYYATADIRTR
jgi:hypothetical protein